MSKTIPASEFRKMNKKDPALNAIETFKACAKAADVAKQVRDGKLSVEEALKAMGHYFELEEKQIKFFIKQLQLSGKI